MCEVESRIAARTDPFCVRTISADSQIDEVDRSDDVLQALRAARIQAVISIVVRRKNERTFS